VRAEGVRGGAAYFSNESNILARKLIVTDHVDGWRMQINLREPGRNPMTMPGYMAPTVEGAKAIADKEIAKYGHVCLRHARTGLKFHKLIPGGPERDSGAIQTSVDRGDGASSQVEAF
jgi:hypothetical protein